MVITRATFSQLFKVTGYVAFLLTFLPIFSEASSNPTWVMVATLLFGSLELLTSPLFFISCFIAFRTWYNIWRKPDLEIPSPNDEVELKRTLKIINHKVKIYSVIPWLILVGAIIGVLLYFTLLNLLGLLLWIFWWVCCAEYFGWTRWLARHYRALGTPALSSQEKSRAEEKGLGEDERVPPQIGMISNDAKEPQQEETIQLREKQVRLIKKTVVELGTRFTRLGVAEIAEKCALPDEVLIIETVQEMISKGEIHAEYFHSTKSVAFDQLANMKDRDNFIAKLEAEFAEWGRIGKKG